MFFSKPCRGTSTDVDDQITFTLHHENISSAFVDIVNNITENNIPEKSNLDTSGRIWVMDECIFFKFFKWDVCGPWWTEFTSLFRMKVYNQFTQILSIICHNNLTYIYIYIIYIYICRQHFSYDVVGTIMTWCIFLQIYDVGCLRSLMTRIQNIFQNQNISSTSPDIVNDMQEKFNLDMPCMIWVMTSSVQLWRDASFL